MRIRDYTAQDLDAVILLNVQATDPNDSAENSKRYNPDLLDIPQVYQADGAFLVGEADGQIIAMGAIRREDPDTSTFTLTRIRTAIPHQRRGLARRLVEALEDRARVLGARTITLDTTDRQIAAQRLYETLGYTHTHDSVLTNGFGVFNLIHYRKDFE